MAMKKSITRRRPPTTGRRRDRPAQPGVVGERVSRRLKMGLLSIVGFYGAIYLVFGLKWCSVFFLLNVGYYGISNRD
jgi:hypothetical protein